MSSSFSPVPSPTSPTLAARAFVRSHGSRSSGVRRSADGLHPVHSEHEPPEGRLTPPIGRGARRRPACLPAGGPPTCPRRGSGRSRRRCPRGVTMERDEPLPAPVPTARPRGRSRRPSVIGRRQISPGRPTRHASNTARHRSRVASSSGAISISAVVVGRWTVASDVRSSRSRTSSPARSRTGRRSGTRRRRGSRRLAAIPGRGVLGRRHPAQDPAPPMGRPTVTPVTDVAGSSRQPGR